MSEQTTPQSPNPAPWDVSTEIAEWLLVQQIADLQMRLQTDATRYEVLGISGILRALIGDKGAVIDVARRRLDLAQPRFSHTPYQLAGDDRHRLILGFAHVSQFAEPSVDATLAEFLRAPAAIYDEQPVSVRDVIRFFANVQGGVHLGVPRLPFEMLAHSLIGYLHVDVGHAWMKALISIATVTVAAAQPLVDAIVSDRPELATGAWSDRRRLRAADEHP